jgi:dienelactone hydrolase
MRHAALLLLLLAVPQAGHAAAAPDAVAACAASPGSHDGVRVHETSLAGVPALLRVPARVTRPPIVLWHGFGPPASERALMAQLPLDDVPAVKVYLGLPLFGARSPADKGELARRQAADLAMQVFEPVVLGAARELPAVAGALRGNGCLHAGERIGLFGFSAGGAAALDALARRDVPVGAAVVLNASTGLGASVAAYERATGKQYPWSAESRALARSADAVARAGDIAAGTPALLIIQGSGDTMLTPEPARQLHAALAAHYADRIPLALELIDGMPHSVVDGDDLARVRESVAGWFNANLRDRAGS